MHYKTKSIITVLVLIGIMLVIGLVIRNVDTNITGAAVQQCECANDIECNDYNACTEDKCLYPESCAASRCINADVPECAE